MNITREVMTDLLPVYFSGEASEDTKRLMEDYFRQNPDFERIARSAARPLETLRATTPVAPEAAREKRDLQWARDGLFWRKLWFGVALVFTIAPFVSVYSHGHLDWSQIWSNPWPAVSAWSWALPMWVVSFARLSRRTYILVWAIFFTLIPLVWGFHLLLPGWQTGLSMSSRLVWVIIAPWFFAALNWIRYLRLRSDSR